MHLNCCQFSYRSTDARLSITWRGIELSRHWVFGGVPRFAGNFVWCRGHFGGVGWFRICDRAFLRKCRTGAAGGVFVRNGGRALGGRRIVPLVLAHRATGQPAERQYAENSQLVHRYFLHDLVIFDIRQQNGLRLVARSAPLNKISCGLFQST